MRHALVFMVALAAACAHRTVAERVAAPPAPPAALEMEPMRIDVERSPDGLRARTYDARSLLEDGNEALVLRRYDEAIAAYDHLLTDFPDSALRAAALYNAGQAYEGKLDWEGAAARYRRLIEVAPTTPETKEDRKNAHFRGAAVLAEAGQVGESAALLGKVLEWNDLTPDERIEALARLGFAHVQGKEMTAAEDVLRQAIAYHREVQGTHRLETTYFVAMAQFYLGEIPHQQFLAIPLRYPEEQMQRDAEQKSQLFLLARDRFVKAVEYKSPIWATAAVFQVASMYKEFWDAWMAVPIPADFGPDEAREYTKEVNEEAGLRRLLEKALFFHEKNLTMARDARVDTGWSKQSGVEAESLRQLLAQLSRGDYIRPGIAVQAPGVPTPLDSGSHRPVDGYIPARPEL